MQLSVEKPTTARAGSLNQNCFAIEENSVFNYPRICRVDPIAYYNFSLSAAVIVQI